MNAEHSWRKPKPALPCWRATRHRRPAGAAPPGLGWPQVAAQDFDNHLVFYQPARTTSSSSACCMPPATGGAAGPGGLSAPCQTPRPPSPCRRTRRPQRQRAAPAKEVDGWLIRLSPGKAKRSAASMRSRPAACRWTKCWRAASAALRPPACPSSCGSRPGANRRAWMSASRPRAGSPSTRPMCWCSTTSPDPRRLPSPPLDAQAYAATVGALRGSSAKAIAAHAERTANAPVPYQGFGLFDSAGGLLACGQIVREGSLVGLYDIASARPRQGHAERLCAAPCWPRPTPKARAGLPASRL